MVEELNKLGAREVDSIISEHKVQLVDLNCTRSIVVYVVEDALDLLIAEDLVLGLQVLLLDRRHRDGSKRLIAALLEALVEPADDLRVLGEQLRVFCADIDLRRVLPGRGV